MYPSDIYTYMPQNLCLYTVFIPYQLTGIAAENESNNPRH